GRSLALMAALWPARALADEEAPPLQTLVEPGEGGADLRLRQLPVRMKIRPIVAAAPAEPAAPGATAAAEPPASASKPATATTWPAIRERVSYQVRAGVQLDTAGDSGETMRGGARLPDDFTGSRPWILGDAIVSARDILLPSLGAYLLSSFQLDA